MRPTHCSRTVGVAILLLVVTSCDFVERASVNQTGGDPNGGSFDPSISADGRYVSFWSSADNLVPGDDNRVNDVFVRDLRTDTTRRVSLDATGDDPNGESFFASISGDGRYVAFASSATDLVAGDTVSGENIYVRDLVMETTTRATVAVGGGNPDAGTRHARISADGRHVVFASPASDVVAGDLNGVEDVFVRDLDAGTTTRASLDTANGDPNNASGSTGGFSPPAIDADGTRVVFFSAASDLVAADGNGLTDMFMRDLTAGTTVRVSVDPAGGDPNGASDESCGRPAITGDGRFVAFCSFASNLIPADANGAGTADVFVRDLQQGTTALASGDTHGGSGPSISDDGRHVAFQTTQVFVHDMQNGTTRLASAKSGRPADGISGNAPISADGRYVAFLTSASNLDDRDHNESFDIYVRAVAVPEITSVTPSALAAGGSATLTVHGSGFLPGVQVLATIFAPLDVTVDAVDVVSETELRIAVRVDPDAPSGRRIVAVSNPGTGPGLDAVTFGVCATCFSVS